MADSTTNIAEYTADSCAVPVSKISVAVRPLKGQSTIDRVFKHGKKLRHSMLFARYELNSTTTLRVVSHHSTILHVVNIGVVVPKKNAKRSVMRNRLKRLMRESVRSIAVSSPELLTSFASMMILWNLPVALSVRPKHICLSDVLPEVRMMLEIATYGKSIRVKKIPS